MSPNSPTSPQSSNADPNCIFCKIVAGAIPAKKLSEDDHAIAIADVSPQAPTHVLVMPKIHIPNIASVESSELMAALFHKAAKLAAELGLDKGFRLVVNTGDDGGQTVHHLHIHLLGGRSLGWPPG